MTELSDVVVSHLLEYGLIYVYNIYARLVVLLGVGFALRPPVAVVEAVDELEVRLDGGVFENRIAVERRKFNEITRGFNTSVRKFPASIVAGMTDFEKKGYFEAIAGSEVAPVVEF